jgi:hypothetical protein
MGGFGSAAGLISCGALVSVGDGVGVPDALAEPLALLSEGFASDDVFPEPEQPVRVRAPARATAAATPVERGSKRTG